MNKQLINRNQLFLFISGLSFLVACNNVEEPEKMDNNITLKVTADAETEPVPSKEGEDAADDPAIWIHPEDAAKSTIIGTNKKDGLAVYDLNGKEIHYYSVGNINNADVRYGFPLGKDSIDIVGGSNRSDNSILIMKINKRTGALEEVAARDFISDVKEVYGFCMYHSPVTGKYYAIANGKEGEVEQWELMATNNQKIDLKKIRVFNLESQPEGMVADDEKADLYIGEEMKGIWKYSAEPDSGNVGEFVALSDTSNQNIEYDVEGLTIYYASAGKGYLIASSQGNYSYAVFSREGDNEYIASFRIKDGLIDGAEETDGLDVTNYNLGLKFPNGLLVVQDGFNYENDSLANQNFKLVSWDKVAKLTEPNLIVDNNYQFLR